MYLYYTMDYKQKKAEILEWMESPECSERERSCIKLLWGRRPSDYGIRVYRESVTICFD
jgi:hypothetical protein